MVGCRAQVVWEYNQVYKCWSQSVFYGTFGYELIEPPSYDMIIMILHGYAHSGSNFTCTMYDITLVEHALYSYTHFGNSLTCQYNLHSIPLWEYFYYHRSMVHHSTILTCMTWHPSNLPDVLFFWGGSVLCRQQEEDEEERSCDNTSTWPGLLWQDFTSGFGQVHEQATADHQGLSDACDRQSPKMPLDRFPCSGDRFVFSHFPYFWGLFCPYSEVTRTDHPWTICSWT